jgi:hypothetical protein
MVYVYITFSVLAAVAAVRAVVLRRRFGLLDGCMAGAAVTQVLISFDTFTTGDVHPEGALLNLMILALCGFLRPAAARDPRH